MGRRIIEASILCMLVVLMSGCTARKDINNKIVSTEENTSTEKLSNTNEGMLYDLNINKASYIIDRAYDNDNTNILFSPLSLNFALGMLNVGSDGDTRNELNNYLNNYDYNLIAKKYLYEIENTIDTNNIVEIANSIWVAKKYKINKDFKSIIKDEFGASIHKVSFKEKHKTLDKINKWSDKKTHGMIPKILNENSITNSTKAILVNSLYFNSEWEKPWELVPGKDSFKKNKDTFLDAEYIETNTNCYYENNYATAFGCDYKNGMIFIGVLPKNYNDDSFSVLDLDLESLLKSESKESVYAKMPKMTFDYNYKELKHTLINMGLKTIFDSSKADIPNIINNNFVVNDIIQKCKIIIDENKTEASAVTAIETCNSVLKMEHKEVILDRPYVFMIYDRVNDKILFIGKVVDTIN